jgi:radical SAM protein with 4Fe4S-binding SPASM domain
MNAAAPLPSFVQLEPVGQCNLKCRMCPVTWRGDGGPGRAPAFMAYETFCRLLEQFPAVNELHLQGLGEPLLHPRFFDMVRHAAARGIEVSTNTNLTAFSPRRAEDCVASGLARMHVSVDAATPEVYSFIRVGSRLERVLRNLNYLQEAKRQHHTEKPEVRFVMVAMRRNLGELPGLARLAREHGVGAISVQHLAHDFTESSLPERYASMRAFVDEETLLNEDAAVVERAFDNARKAADEAGIELRLPNLTPRPPRTHPRCDWPWRGAYLSYSGEAMPCCMVATPDRKNFGNMASQGVAKIWSSDEYRKFREQLLTDTPPEICSGCAVYQGRF